MSGRAVITGVGVVAPSGTSADEHWATITAGESRLGQVAAFDASAYPTRVAGEVHGLDVAATMDGRLIVQTDRWTQMAFAAAEEALADAALRLADADPYQVSVILASSSGGNQFGQRELQRLWSQPSRTVSAYQSIAWFYAATVGQLSIRHQAKGPSNVLAAEGAGGLDSLAHAARMLRRGVSIVLAGGIEAPLSPYALSCQIASRMLSHDEDPLSAYRPFDVTASGYVPGEGGAILIAEDLDHALARDAPAIQAEIAGWGATHDGHHARAAPGHAQYARSMRMALERAGIRPDEVDLLIPDAMGVPGYDRGEARAITEVFGPRGVPVTSHKSLIGRMYQGGAALDVVTALRAMREQVIPAITGLTQPPEDYDIDFVRDARQANVSKVLVCARGFDGYNSSLLLTRHQDGRAT